MYISKVMVAPSLNLWGLRSHVFFPCLTPTRDPKCGDPAKATVCRLTSLAKVWFLLDT